MERIQHLALHLTSSAEEPAILYETLSNGRIALLTFNRASRGNAFTMEMQQDLFVLLDRANADPQVVVVIVTGKGEKAFCVGADKEMLAGISDPSTFPRANRDIDQIQFLESDKPVIMCINGACAGLGFVTACMGDIRFAVQKAKFTAAFSKRGLVAEHAISYVLPRIVGMSRAMDLLLSSRVVLTEEAVQMGLVNQSFESNELMMKHAVQYAENMADLCSPAAMAEMKKQMYAAWDKTPRAEAEQCNVLMLQSFLHPDSIEGIASLNESRKPKFPGLAAGYIRDKLL